MIRMKKSVITMVFLLSSLFLMAGCGNNNDRKDSTTSSEMTEQKEGSTESTAGTDDSGVGASTEDARQEDASNDAAGGTGDNRDDTSGDAAGDLGNDMKDAAEDVGDAARDVVDGAGKAVDDVADGVGDAIDNLGGGSFDSYEDAKTYLLEKLKKDNAGANYEVRDETKDLTAYNNNDSGAEGYQFSIYETDGNEKIGIYYVDKDTGKIYRYMGKNSIEAY